MDFFDAAAGLFDEGRGPQNFQDHPYGCVQRATSENSRREATREKNHGLLGLGVVFRRDDEREAGCGEAVHILAEALRAANLKQA